MVVVGGSGCCASTPAMSAVAAVPAKAKVMIARCCMAILFPLSAPDAKQAEGQNGRIIGGHSHEESTAVQGRLLNLQAGWRLIRSRRDQCVDSTKRSSAGPMKTMMS